MGFSRPEYWSGLPFPSPRDLPDLGTEPRSPALQADPLPSEPPGKPKNTGVGSLSLLQWIFLTQKSNWGLLHCRQILYQLGYREAPTQGHGGCADHLSAFTAMVGLRFHFRDSVFHEGIRVTPRSRFRSRPIPLQLSFLNSSSGVCRNPGSAIHCQNMSVQGPTRRA